MRRIYVATRFADAALAREVAARFRHAGHATTSGWHEMQMAAEEARAQEGDRAARQAICRKNYADLFAADTLVLLAHADCRGALCETTAAYFRGHDVLIVGEPRDLNLMLDLVGVKWLADVDAVLAYLAGARGRGA